MLDQTATNGRHDEAAAQAGVSSPRLTVVLPMKGRGLFTLRYASAALDGQRRFVDEFNALKQGGHGHVTVGAITGSAAHVLVASVVEIQRLRPLLVLKILEQSSDQLIAWLAEQ